MALLLLNEYKDFMGQGSMSYTPDQSTQIQALILAADRVIKQYCQKDPESQSYIQFYSGNNTSRLVLRQTPITSLTDVRLDNSGYFGKDPLGSFDTTSLLIDGVDYVLDWDSGSSMSRSGILFRIGTVWPVVTRLSRLSRLTPDAGPAFGNIRVSYTAGYSPVPNDLKYATALLVNLMKAKLPLGQFVVGEHIGAYAYTLLKGPPAKQKDDVLAITSLLSSYTSAPW